MLKCKILIKLHSIGTTLTELCLFIPLNVSHNGAADNAAVDATAVYSIFYSIPSEKIILIYVLEDTISIKIVIIT